MPSLIVVAHAPLASSLQAVAEHVYPDCRRQLAAVDVGPQDDLETVAERLREELARLPGDEALILADMFGATPCNAARTVADGLRVRVVAGVNVPMLWRTLCYCERSLDELVQRALDGGTQGVLHVPAENRRQNQREHPGRHDPHDDPHQQ